MIRRATSGEAALLARIVDASYGHYVARLGRKPAPMVDDYDARIAAGQAWVLSDDDVDMGLVVMGLVVIEDRPDGLLLDNIAVLPAAQGRKFGSTLMTFVEEEARRRGYAAVHLYTNALMTENQARYRHLGYVETHRVTEKGFERVYMTKRLG